MTVCTTLPAPFYRLDEKDGARTFAWVETRLRKTGVALAFRLDYARRLSRSLSDGLCDRFRVMQRVVDFFGFDHHAQNRLGT